MRSRSLGAHALCHCTELEFKSCGSAVLRVIATVSCSSVLAAVNSEFETMEGVVDRGAGLLRR